MTTFKFTETVPSNEIISAALGTTNAWVTNDIGKCVKLSTANNYIVCSAGNDIDGFVTSVEPFTVNSGYAFGGVLIEGRITAKVGPNQVSTLNVGDYVVADTQAAMGTASLPLVKAGVAFAQSGTTPFAVTQATPTHAFWRCISIVSGTGVAGDTVILERV